MTIAAKCFRSIRDGDALKDVGHDREGGPFSPCLRYPICMGKWCTVTVMDGGGQLHSLDVNADSSYDAAHLYLTHVRGNPGCGLPIPTTSTQFGVITEGRIHNVQGARLKKWIENRRREWQGPRGMLFARRPMIGD
jgi:hypothetical protein